MENKSSGRYPGCRRTLRTITVLVFLGAVLSAAIVPINSHDFWWHLKTGEYILRFHELPDQDPFTYTSTPDDPDFPGRPAFILKQYWVAQIFYAVINSTFGLKGIIALRGLVYVAMALAVVSITLKFASGRVYLGLLVLFVLSTRPALEDSDRPQMFSFLFAFLTVAIVEWAIRKKVRWPLFLNVPLLLLAANMHGGYVVALVYLLIYVLCGLFEQRLRPMRTALLLSTLAAFLASYLNPTHWKAFGEAFNILEAPLFASTILEYMPPFKILPHSLQNPGWAAYWALVLLSLPAAVHYFRRKIFSIGILLTISLVASLISMRFIYFFVPLGSVFTSLFLQDVLFSRMKSFFVPEIIAISLFISAAFFRPGHPNYLGVNTVLREMSFPISAADFLDRQDLPRPLYNEMQWGGYLEWRLWPKYKMFVDTRQLINRTYGQYLQIMYSPGGSEMLKAYGMATVITPAIDPYTGQILPLVRSLYFDKEWSLVYQDGQSLVLVRKVLARNEIAKSNVYKEVLQEADYWRRLFPWVKTYDSTVSEAIRELALAAPQK